jgi:hypothetical protein
VRLKRATVVGIEEDAVAPNSGDNLIAGNNLAPVLEQQDQDLERDALQLHHTIAASQPAGMHIKFEVVADPDRSLCFNWLESPMTHPGEENLSNAEIRRSLLGRLAGEATKVLVITTQSSPAIRTSVGDPERRGRTSRLCPCRPRT